MRRLRLSLAVLAAAPVLGSCAMVQGGFGSLAHAVHQLAFSRQGDDAPMAYTRDALAEAAVLYPPAHTTIILPPHHPRLTAAVRAAGYAVSDSDGPAAGGALPVRFSVHSGSDGVDVAVLQIGEQTLTRGYMRGQPATGWSYDAQNASPRTLERLSLMQRGVPIDQVTYADAGATRAAPSIAPAGAQP